MKYSRKDSLISQLRSFVLKRFAYLTVLVMGCSDGLEVKTDTSMAPYDDITLATTADVTDDTGCDSGKLCDTAG
jgi:hypothetical protein|tara:strand:+ start:383 stop:604 length:222 start_codon:yes stop_codon:yes gene_type:complete